ncbi:hypothetical protein [Mycolicibacter arupensis]|jgi:hypothetical protein|nr:hypothetical protein [Mycolicibacter arupensis]MCV7277051.1 hypothetical protein [Mycolicibacter arupensis]
MNPLLDSLIAQWKRCGGTRGECRTRNCKRCIRAAAFIRTDEEAGR